MSDGSSPASTKDNVRHLLSSKASRDEIMEALSIAFRTYLRYVEAIREEDSKVLSKDKKVWWGNSRKPTTG